jgi:hypothetical protein
MVMLTVKYGPPGGDCTQWFYDNDRKIIVLFGGVDESRDFNDTWELTIKESTEEIDCIKFIRSMNT